MDICTLGLNILMINDFVTNNYYRSVASSEQLPPADSKPGLETGNIEHTHLSVPNLVDDEVFRLLAKHSSDGIAVFEYGKPIYSSPAYNQMFLSDAKGKQVLNIRDILERIHPDDLPGLMEKLSRAIKKKLATHTYHFRFRKPDGSYCWLENSVSRQFDAKGRVYRLYTITRNITDRKNRELKLQLSEKRFRTLFSQNAIGIFTIDTKGNFLQANNKFTQMLGCEASELYSQNIASIIHPASIDTSNNLIQQTLQAKDSEFSFETQFLKKNGAHIWVEAYASVVFDGSQNTETIMISVCDISWRKETEHALHESRNTLQAVMDNTTAIIYMKDLEGRYTFVNKQFKKVHGTSDKKIIGKTDLEYTNPESAASYRRHDLLVMKSKKPLVCEESAIMDDGKHFAISAKVPLFDQNKKVYGICGITTDITAHKKTEHELLDIKTKLELALSNAKMGIWEWYVENNKVAWFGNHAQLFGISQDDFEGTIDEVRMCMHPEDRNLGFAAFNKTLREETEFFSTYRVVWPDKSVRWLYSYGNLVKDHNGKAVKIVGTTQDITLEKLSNIKIVKQNEKLTQLISTKDKLFSIISHDLVNPLNSLLGYAQLLHKQYLIAPRETIGHYQKVILQSGNAIADLLDTLSQWSRSQRKSIRVQRKEINIYILAKKCIDLLSASANKKKIRLINNIPRDQNAFADEDMITTVLRNILSNAIKFTHPKGQIILNTIAQNEMCIIKVSDTGVGMADLKLQNLFNIAGVESENGTAGEKGTGLGLLICKEFVELNNGRIWVESMPNKGSSFYVEIPAQALDS